MLTQASRSRLIRIKNAGFELRTALVINEFELRPVRLTIADVRQAEEKLGIKTNCAFLVGRCCFGHTNSKLSSKVESLAFKVNDSIGKPLNSFPHALYFIGAATQFFFGACARRGSSGDDAEGPHSLVGARVLNHVHLREFVRLHNKPSRVSNAYVLLARKTKTLSRDA